MEVKEYLHMKQGEEEFSYAQNTIIQSTAADRTKSVIEKAIYAALSDIKLSDDRLLKVADLGCGVGPVPLAFISMVTQIVQKNCSESLNWDDNDNRTPDIQICLNDLPSNDFKTLFRDLGVVQVQGNGRDLKLPKYFVTAVPGSFHDRLFPPNSVHFVHSNYAIHWLSQVPRGLQDQQGMQLNKRNINVTYTTPPAAAEAYLAQFQTDWTLFLNNRANEVVPSGRVALVIRGRTWKHYDQHQPSNVELHLLCQAIISLVSQGLIEEEKLDTFEFPTYHPCKEEVQEVVAKQGSFEIEHIETIVDHIAQGIEDKHERAQVVLKCIRAFTEPLISRHFGEDILPKIYSELNQITVQYMATNSLELCSIIVLLRRIEDVLE